MPGPASLHQLIAATAAGDRAAFSRLYEATSAHLFAVALRMVRRRDWAEDVLQEAYVNLWNHAGTYQAERGEPLAWLTSIVRYRALDRLRRNRESASLDVVPDYENRPDPGPGPLDWALHSDSARALSACLDRLGQQQRQAILLVYYDGLTHEELADHFHIPLGTAKSWVRRGLQRVKECLAQ